MLGGHVQVVTPDQVVSSEDLLAWAQKCDDQMLPAGAADFFKALLQSRGRSLDNSEPSPPPGRGGTDSHGPD